MKKKQHCSFFNEKISFYRQSVSCATAYRYRFHTTLTEQALWFLFVQRNKNIVIALNIAYFKRVADNLTVYIKAVRFDAKIGGFRASDSIIDVD